MLLAVNSEYKAWQYASGVNFSLSYRPVRVNALFRGVVEGFQVFVLKAAPCHVCERDQD